MNIIFGKAVDSIPDNYTKLELDTFRMDKTGQTITAYCLVEHIPLGEFPRVENNRQNHQALLENYKKQNWEFCKQTIPFLIGAWNGEVDSFYNELLDRIEKFQCNPPPLNWDGVIDKN
jgi:hypothetical protein